MRCCPICHGTKRAPYGLGVWELENEDAPSEFGFGSTDKHGEVCCSFGKELFKSKAEAQEAVSRLDIEEVYAEHDDCSGAYADMSDYGPPDSDPYDRDGPYY